LEFSDDLDFLLEFSSQMSKYIAQYSTPHKKSYKLFIKGLNQIFFTTFTECLHALKPSLNGMYADDLTLLESVN